MPVSHEAQLGKRDELYGVAGCGAGEVLAFTLRARRLTAGGPERVAVGFGREARAPAMSRGFLDTRAGYGM